MGNSLDLPYKLKSFSKFGRDGEVGRGSGHAKATSWGRLGEPVLRAHPRTPCSWARGRAATHRDVGERPAPSVRTEAAFLKYPAPTKEHSRTGPQIVQHLAEPQALAGVQETLGGLERPATILTLLQE